MSRTVPASALTAPAGAPARYARPGASGPVRSAQGRRATGPVAALSDRPPVASKAGSVEPERAAASVLVDEFRHVARVEDGIAPERGLDDGDVRDITVKDVRDAPVRVVRGRPTLEEARDRRVVDPGSSRELSLRQATGGEPCPEPLRKRGRRLLHVCTPFVPRVPRDVATGLSTRCRWNEGTILSLVPKWCAQAPFARLERT